MPKRNGANNEQGANNNGNAKQENEYLGIKELFGDFSFDNVNFTEEEMQQMLNDARKKSEEEASRQNKSLADFMAAQFQNAQTRNVQFAQGNGNVEEGAKIPGMNYVPQVKPNEDKKQSAPALEQHTQASNIADYNIPGMNGDIKVGDGNAPQKSEEERKKDTLEFAQKMLQELRAKRGGSTEDMRDRNNLIRYYQDIVDRNQSFEDFVERQNKLAQEKRRQAEENERRRKELEENIQSGLNDIIEDDVPDENENEEVQEPVNEVNALTEEQRQRRARDDERLAQMMVNFRREMEEIDAEEEAEERARAEQEREQVEGVRQRAPQPLDFLFEEDDEAEIDPFAPAGTITMPQMPVINAAQPEQPVEQPAEQPIEQPVVRELTEEERQRRARDDERLAQMRADFQRDMAQIDAEEEAADGQQQNQEEMNEPQPIARRPIEDLLGNDDDDDNAEFDPFALRHGPVVFQAPVINAVPQPNPQNREENNAQREPDEAEVQQNNPPRELTEEERQRRAQDDARMEQAMQNFRKDMADIDAEDEAEKQARRAVRREEKRLKQEERQRVEQEHLARAKVEQDFFTNLDNEGDLFAESKESIEKKAQRTERKEKMAAGTANESVFQNTLQAYNTMYKTNINADDFASRVSDAFTMMKKTDPAEAEKGKKMLGDLFKETLKKTYALEKEACYNEHRIPDFPDIIKSTNGLMRSAMYAFTDMYHDKKNIPLFDKTVYAGLSAKELAEVAMPDKNDGLWGMDQKSDAAWEIQSKVAKDIAKQWLEDDRPYEKMIVELNALAEQARTNVSVDRIDRMNKLMAAEWMLINNPKMMVEDPEDPYNTIPNWGNKYWKTLSAARDALGISKHTSMRDLVQADYAEAARAINSVAYNERQIEDYALDDNVRQVYDNRNVQMNQFATQAAAAILTEQQSKQKADEIIMTDDQRVQISVRECDEKVIWQSQPKENNFIVERNAEMQIDTPDHAPRA